MWYTSTQLEAAAAVFDQSATFSSTNSILNHQKVLPLEQGLFTPGTIVQELNLVPSSSGQNAGKVPEFL